MHFQGFCQKVTNTLLVQVYCSDSTWNSGKSWKTQRMLFWSQKKNKKKTTTTKKPRNISGDSKDIWPNSGIFVFCRGKQNSK